MQVINFSEQNSVMNHYMAELRDKKYQQNCCSVITSSASVS